MTAKSALRAVTASISLFITAPIWYYLMYKVLKMVGATELMMFLFWVYVPVGIFTSILKIIVDEI